MAFTSYDSFVTGFTTNQFVLPLRPGVFSWTVTVQSGAASINGFTLVAGNQIHGGGYGTATLAGNSSLVVGCTGGNVLVNWDTISF